MLKNKRKCLRCGKAFSPKNDKHLFCIRTCYRKYYWAKVEKSNSFPKIICPHCNNKTELTFNPMKNYVKFRHVCCQHCGKKIKKL